MLKIYRVSLGANPVGHKAREGDFKTPEGTYKVDYKISNSKYHLSLHLSYPNVQDKKNAKENKVSPGGDICIHGLHTNVKHLGASHIEILKTRGCIVVTNEEIEGIWKQVHTGTPVEIQA